MVYRFKSEEGKRAFAKKKKLKEKKPYKPIKSKKRKPRMGRVKQAEKVLYDSLIPRSR